VESTCDAGRSDDHPLLPAPDDECDVAARFTLEQKRFTGHSTGSAVEAFVLLPVGYDASRAEPYPVIYSLHPAEKDTSKGNGVDFFQVMRWRLEATMCGFFRMNTDDYIYVYPRGGDACYVNSMDGVTSMAEDVVVKDVVAHVTQNYNAAVKGNVCFGMSMGAYGCLLFGLRYPEVGGPVVIAKVAVLEYRSFLPGSSEK
jgi:enterochelin esterase-like enzyme